MSAGRGRASPGGLGRPARRIGRKEHTCPAVTHTLTLQCVATGLLVQVDGPHAGVEWRQGVNEVGPLLAALLAQVDAHFCVCTCVHGSRCVATWGRVLFLLTCPGREGEPLSSHSRTQGLLPRLAPPWGLPWVPARTAQLSGCPRPASTGLQLSSFSSGLELPF